GEADDGRVTIEQVEKLRTEVLLLDLLMPNLRGIEALRELSARGARSHTIVFSASVGPEQVVQALQLGARGILSKKSIAQLEPAMRSVLNGKYWVEGREERNISRILADLAQSMRSGAHPRTDGLTRREIEIEGRVPERSSNPDI